MIRLPLSMHTTNISEAKPEPCVNNNQKAEIAGFGFKHLALAAIGLPLGICAAGMVAHKLHYRFFRKPGEAGLITKLLSYQVNTNITINNKVYTTKGRIYPMSNKSFQAVALERFHMRICEKFPDAMSKPPQFKLDKNLQTKF